MRSSGALALISGVASGSRPAPASERVYSYESIFRRSFNITLLIVGIFATAGGASPNYIALCSFATVWSIGVGGNLPVDSAIFLGKRCTPSAPFLYTLPHVNVTSIGFVPASHQYLLTVLSIWWAFGQLMGSLVRPDIRPVIGDCIEIRIHRSHGR